MHADEGAIALYVLLAYMHLIISTLKWFPKLHNALGIWSKLKPSGHTRAWAGSTVMCTRPIYMPLKRKWYPLCVCGSYFLFILA
jgi:hypothetical protein